MSLPVIVWALAEVGAALGGHGDVEHGRRGSRGRDGKGQQRDEERSQHDSERRHPPDARVARRMRFFEFESRQIVAKAGIPVSGHGFAKTPAEARKIAEELGAPTRHQVAGSDRRADEGGRRQVRRYARGSGASCGGHPPVGDQRPHAPRGARRLPRRRRAGVLRRRHLGRHPQAAGPDLQRHGRDRHRGGRRDPPRPRRARPLLDPAAVQRLRGQAGDRLGRRHRPRADPADADPGPAGAAVHRVRHDAGRDQPAGAARRRLVRRRRRPHGHGERGAPAPEGAAGRARRRRRGDAPGPRGDRRSSSPARPSTSRTTAAWPAT